MSRPASQPEVSPAVSPVPTARNDEHNPLPEHPPVPELRARVERGGAEKYLSLIHI